jgi:hypothetical protein
LSAQHILRLTGQMLHEGHGMENVRFALNHLLPRAVPQLEHARDNRDTQDQDRHGDDGSGQVPPEHQLLLESRYPVHEISGTRYKATVENQSGLRLYN